MIFQPLASSSKGNAYIVSDGDTRILLECGLSHKELQKRCGFQLSEISACLVSHEHADHSKCAERLLRDGIPVYMSEGTASALELPEPLLKLATAMEPGVQFSVGTMDILPFPTFHNTREPLGFCVRSRLDGEVCVFAIDTVNLPYIFPGVTILAVEANFQQSILESCQRMPEKTRYRITCSHMEIDTLCQCLQRMDLRQCREIWLLHLSDATSHELQFIHKVQRVVPRGIRVSAAMR